MRNALSWLVFASFALVASPQAQAQWWNPLAPKTYEDCVLKGMKGVTSDDAAKLIASACDDKFYPTVPTVACQGYRNLSPAERALVKQGGGSLSREGTPYFTGRLYNGSGVPINYVTFVARVEGYELLTYTADISSGAIAPNTSGEITATLNQPTGYNDWAWRPEKIQTCYKWK